MRALLFFFFALTAHAAPNDFYSDLFAPGYKPGTRVRAEFRRYENAHAGGKSFGLEQTRVDLSTPVLQSESSTWRAHVYGDYDALSTNAVFSNGRSLPKGLWDAGAGFSNTRALDGGKSFGANFTVGSASNQPFRHFRDLGFNLNLTYKLPQENEAAWILFLGWSNTRNFLNYIPLPGAAYFFKARENLRMLLGVPFLLAYWLPGNQWTVTAFVFPIRTGELKVAYGNPRGLQPYALVKYGTNNFRLTDRANSKERLFFDEGVAQVGLNLPVARGAFLDLSGGQSFARRYYLAEKATQRSGAPGIAADNALFANAKVSASF